MTEKILSILNPVHLPTVSEWMEIAIEIDDDPITRLSNFYKLQSRFEELTRGKVVNNSTHSITKDRGHLHIHVKTVFQPALLTKSMFVCEVEEPEPLNIETRKSFVTEDENLEHRMYNKAQSQIWFEGFGIMSKSEISCSDKIQLWFPTPVMVINHNSKLIENIDTVFDFIIELDRFNRTASEKIKINWSSNFVNELLK